MDHSDEYYKMKYFKYKAKYEKLKLELEGGNTAMAVTAALGTAGVSALGKAGKAGYAGAQALGSAASDGVNALGSAALNAFTGYSIVEIKKKLADAKIQTSAVQTIDALIALVNTSELISVQDKTKLASSIKHSCSNMLSFNFGSNKKNDKCVIPVTTV